jgi:predicted Zn-dependent peptidase
VLELCREQLALVAADGMTAEEVDRGKGQLRGGLVLGLEDTGSRMSRLGKAELVYGDLMPVEEVLAAIDAVTAADVLELARELFAQPLALAAIGPYDDDRALSAAVA